MSEAKTLAETILDGLRKASINSKELIELQFELVEGLRVMIAEAQDAELPVSSREGIMTGFLKAFEAYLQTDNRPKHFKVWYLLNNAYRSKENAPRETKSELMQVVEAVAAKFGCKLLCSSVDEEAWRIDLTFTIGESPVTPKQLADWAKVPEVLLGELFPPKWPKRMPSETEDGRVMW